MTPKEFSIIISELNLIERHSDFNRGILDEISGMDFAVVKNIACPQARRAYEMQRNVSCTIHRKIAFSRFAISPHGILSARIGLIHDIMDIVIMHFHKRFPLFNIVIEDTDAISDKGIGHVTRKRTCSIDTRGKIKWHDCSAADIVSGLESVLPINPLIEGVAADDSENSNAWKAYYASQYIPQRRNIKLQKKFMPMKYREDRMEQDLSSRSADLRIYIDAAQNRV